MVAVILARLIGGAVLATGGWRLGEYISDVWGPEQYVPLVFGLSIGGDDPGFGRNPLYDGALRPQPGGPYCSDLSRHALRRW